MKWVDVLPQNEGKEWIDLAIEYKTMLRLFYAPYEPMEDITRFVEYSSGYAEDFHRLMCYYGDSVVGFAMIGFGRNKHPDVDYYLQEIYVRPMYEDLGFARAMFEEIVNKYPGKYCYYVYKENKNAEDIWKHLFKGVDYEVYKQVEGFCEGEMNFFIAIPTKFP